MAYNSIVLVKQVPDTKAVTGKAMNDDGTVNRAALPAIFNPEDLNALELALEIKERYGGTVTVVTMGLPSACRVLRAALCRGADRGVLVTDRRAAASDTLATSYILSCAVKHIGDYDLVLCGRQAIDGDTAQVGPQIAEKLELPQITYVEELHSIEDGVMTAKRNVGNGWEKVQVKLPALLTVMNTANTPRPAGGRLMMQYKKARSLSELEQDGGSAADAEKLKAKGLLIDQWDLDDLKADLQWCGRDGSPTKVHRIQSVVLTATEQKEVEPTDDGLRGMVHELISDHTIG
ncbi:MAG: electron transfer flavoprotein subunit beta/FixA family protein [Sedimentisphaerales bacterium]|nr:electron transfer flavoprotein subunit beta/FixA family protein [Sedimentisphaerales bacterium]